LWGVGIGQEIPPVKGLLTMVQYLSFNRLYNHVDTVFADMIRGTRDALGTNDDGWLTSAKY
jgi:hypothetical protein